MNNLFHRVKEVSKELLLLTDEQRSNILLRIAERAESSMEQLLLANSIDLQKLEKFLEGKPLAEQDIGRQLLKETTAYAESSVCRRKLLLHYFGETYEVENCGNCDNCLNPKKQIEAQDMLELLL